MECRRYGDCDGSCYCDVVFVACKNLSGAGQLGYMSERYLFVGYLLAAACMCVSSTVSSVCHK